MTADRSIGPIESTALRYTSIGWAVFPCHSIVDGRCSCGNPDCDSPGKHPESRHGVKDATTDPARINKWGARWETSNIGIACGATSGVFVLDVDPRNGGDKSLATLGAIPETIEQITGGGGRQFFFRTPAGIEIKNSAGTVGEGLDIRGEGGYGILPPSNHKSGGIYRWREGHGPGEIQGADAPAWLLEAVLGTAKEAKREAYESDPRLDAIEEGAEIHEGERNDVLYRYGCRARAYGKDRQEIEDLLDLINREQCVPGPVPARELKAIVESVMRHEPGKSPEFQGPGLMGGEDLGKRIDAIQAVIVGAGRPPLALDLVLGRDDDLKLLATCAARAPGRFGDFLKAIEKAIGRPVAKIIRDRLKGVTALKDPASALPSSPASVAFPVLKALPDLEGRIPANLTLPAGYSISSAPVYTLMSGDYNVAVGPILITLKLSDITTHTDRRKLLWRRDGRWFSFVVDRLAISKKKLLVETLAPHGAPVHDMNSEDLIRFLAMFERVNEVVLPVQEVSSRFGWLEPGKTFLWGRTIIGGEDVEFSPADDGEQRLAEGLSERGGEEGWNGVKAIVVKYPLLSAAVAASLSSPLLRLLGLEPFVIDFCGPTTIGKTTCLRISASVWGDPWVLVRTWNSTIVSAERTAATLCDLPLFFDESQLVRDPAAAAKFIYQHCEGAGRGRGSLRGTQATATWKSVLFSSGEGPIVEMDEKSGGTHARVLTEWGSPFGGKAKVKTEEKTKAEAKVKTDVNNLISLVRENHGWAGPAFIRKLIETPIEDLQRRYKVLLAHYMRRAPSDVGSRLASAVAVIRLASELACLPGRAAAVLLRNLKREAGGANRAEAALGHLRSWVAANGKRFFTGTKTDLLEPNGGWAGQDIGTEVQFYPHVLKEILDDAGFNIGACLRSWSETGVIVSTEGSRKDHVFSVRRRVNGKAERLVVFPWDGELEEDVPF